MKEEHGPLPEFSNLVALNGDACHYSSGLGRGRERDTISGLA